MFVDGLYNLLVGTSSITSLLGTSRKDGTSGIFPSIAPEEVTMPYLVYTEVHREVVLVYAGVNAFQTIRMQFSAYGSVYRQAHLLANAVKALVESFTGQLSEGTLIEQVLPQLEMDQPEPIYKGTKYAVILDYSFNIVANQGE